MNKAAFSSLSIFISSFPASVKNSFVLQEAAGVLVWIFIPTGDLRMRSVSYIIKYKAPNYHLCLEKCHIKPNWVIHCMQVAYEIINATPDAQRTETQFEMEIYGRIGGFHGDLVVKNPLANGGDSGSIPELGRSPGEGNGNPLPIFLPGKSHGQRSLAWGRKRVRHDLAAKQQQNGKMVFQKSIPMKEGGFL